MKRRDLTDEEKREAERLTAAWESYKGANKGATQTWLAAESGLGTQGAVSQYMRAVIPLNVEALMAMCRVIGADPREISPRLTKLVQLPTGLVEQPTPEDSPFGDAPGSFKGARSVRSEDDPDIVPIRRLKLRLRAGAAEYNTEPDMSLDGFEDVPRAVLLNLHLKPDHLLALPVRGDSMHPMFIEDDIVIIDTSDRKPINREIYAVNFNGEGLIKQLLYRGGQWYLHSLNPDHPTVNIKSGECSIVGRVVIQPTRVVTGRL